MPIGPVKEYRKRSTDRVGNALLSGLAAIGGGPATEVAHKWFAALPAPRKRLGAGG
jgi:hypothetical protein